jgi:hypothetical protein
MKLVNSRPLNLTRPRNDNRPSTIGYLRKNVSRMDNPSYQTTRGARRWFGLGEMGFAPTVVELIRS